MDKSEWASYQKTKELLKEQKKLKEKYQDDIISGAVFGLTYPIDETIAAIQYFRENIKPENFKPINTKFYKNKEVAIHSLVQVFYSKKVDYFHHYLVKIKRIKKSVFKSTYNNKHQITFYANSDWMKMSEIPGCLMLGSHSNVITRCKPLRKNIDDLGINLYQCWFKNVKENKLHKTFIATHLENRFFAYSQYKNRAVNHVSKKIARHVSEKLTT